MLKFFFIVFSRILINFSCSFSSFWAYCSCYSWSCRSCSACSCWSCSACSFFSFFYCFLLFNLLWLFLFLFSTLLLSRLSRAPAAAIPHIKRWVRTPKAIIMHLTNGTIQVYTYSATLIFIRPIIFIEVLMYHILIVKRKHTNKLWLIAIVIINKEKWQSCF